MKSFNKDNYKKQSQIFSLKKILNNSNNESNLLNEKIKELQKIFKTLKNIINFFCTENSETIYDLSKNKIIYKTPDEMEIKQNICNTLKKIIKEYKEGNEIISINKKNKEYKKIIKSKLNNVNKLLIKSKYEKIKKEKDILIQTIKEKKYICHSFNNQIDLEKDFQNAFQPKNYIFYDNLYNINIKKLKINQIINKNQKLKDKTKIYLKDIGEKSLKELKEEKTNYMKKINNYIYDKGFNCSFPNKRYKEKYNIKVELIDNYGFSSDSDSDNDEEESNNKIDFMNMNLINKNIFDKDINKKISLSSSEKDTNDQDIKNNGNYLLLNKMVELKEKYNKLINEKYELDYKKNKILKNIRNIKNIKYSSRRKYTFSSIKNGYKLYY